MLGLNLKDYFSITKLLMLGVFITSCSKEGNNICRNTNSEYADMIEQIYEDALNSGYSEEMDECVRHYINYENPTSINYRSEIKFRITENDNEIISLEILGSVGPQDADSELMISGNTFKMQTSYIRTKDVAPIDFIPDSVFLDSQSVLIEISNNNEYLEVTLPQDADTTEIRVLDKNEVTEYILNHARIIEELKKLYESGNWPKIVPYNDDNIKTMFKHRHKLHFKEEDKIELISC